MFETVEEVFDIFTEQHLFYLFRKGVIERLYGVVSSGKEARVYWGVNRKGEDLAIKIYLTMTAEFRKGIAKYIVGDPRFERIPVNDFRRLIYEWTRKEYRNLVRMYDNGVTVPMPYAFRGNVIVMSFIGKNGSRAPLVKEITSILENDSELSYDLLSQTLKNIKISVCKAKLVHADLSEFNLMYWNGKVYFIDVSQAVSLDHPLSCDFLRRDLYNVFSFFERYIDYDDIEKMKEDLIKKLVECLGKDYACDLE